MDRLKIQKWVTWFEVIKQEVQLLCHHKAVFLEIQKIVAANPTIQIESAFWEFLTLAYASNASVTVRRLVKPQKDSISFKGMMQDMVINPSALDLDYYKELYKGSIVEFLAESDFRNYSDSSGKILDAAQIQSDINELQKASMSIEDLVDKRIAHRDKKDPTHTPTYNDLHDCIDTIDKLACKYQLILVASNSSSMTPTIQGDWLAIFREAWIKSN